VTCKAILLETSFMYRRWVDGDAPDWSATRSDWQALEPAATWHQDIPGSTRFREWPKRPHVSSSAIGWAAFNVIHHKHGTSYNTADSKRTKYAKIANKQYGTHLL